MAEPNSKENVRDYAAMLEEATAQREYARMLEQATVRAAELGRFDDAKRLSLMETLVLREIADGRYDD